MRNVDETRRTDIYIYTYIYIYRKFSPVARLGGLAPARPINVYDALRQVTCFNVADVITVEVT